MKISTQVSFLTEETKFSTFNSLNDQDELDNFDNNLRKDKFRKKTTIVKDPVPLSSGTKSSTYYFIDNEQ